MAKTSCVQRIEDDPFIIIRTSYVRICQGDVTAAALISIFEYWHNTKIAARQNHIDMDDRPDRIDDPPSLWQYHKNDDLEAQLMGIGKRERIDKARKLLQEMGIIDIGRNPNKKYKFDATTFYLFHPEVVNAFMQKLKPASAENSTEPVRKTAETGAENSGAIPKDSFIDSPPKDRSGAGAPVDKNPDRKPDKKKKTPGADPDWQRWVDRYEDHVKGRNGEAGHRWDGAQLGPQGLKGIRLHLVKISTKLDGKSDDDCGYGAWCFILDHWDELGDDWLQGQFDLTVILKKITDILNRLRNGTQKNRGGNPGSSNGGTSAARVEAVTNY